MTGTTRLNAATRAIWRESLVAITVLLVAADRASAHPGHERDANSAPASTTLRPWTMVDPERRVRASFESATDTELHLRTATGAALTLPLNTLCEGDRRWVESRMEEIRRLNRQPQPMLVTQLRRIDSRNRVNTDNRNAPRIFQHFKPFENRLKFRWDRDYFFVESNGLPDHQMMVGITAWQQQVPLPQPYVGGNAWRIPLNPVPAERPMSAKTNFFRGAIALAVNGVPIFNPIKNDGRTDTLPAAT